MLIHVCDLFWALNHCIVQNNYMEKNNWYQNNFLKYLIVFLISYVILCFQAFVFAVFSSKIYHKIFLEA